MNIPRQRRFPYRPIERPRARGGVVRRDVLHVGADQPELLIPGDRRYLVDVTDPKLTSEAIVEAFRKNRKTT